MCKAKETRPAVGAAGRAKAGADFTGHVPETNCTTANSPCRVRISVLLGHGPENGITLKHLEKVTNLPGREIRRQIERERRAGVLIVSDNQHGYWLAADPAEAQRFARSMQHRAQEIVRTARAMLNEIGQGQIEGW